MLTKIMTPDSRGKSWYGPPTVDLGKTKGIHIGGQREQICFCIDVTYFFNRICK